MDSSWDVIVVGGGPAGSTVASLVAKAGHRVLVLERTRFPRYQIGESLLLATWEIFDVLGVRDRIANAGFMRKPGATFVWGNESRPWSVFFSELDGRQADSRNVERAKFDAILLDRAVELGAAVSFDAEVRRVVKDASGRVSGVSVFQDGEVRDLHARWVVDASGRSSGLTSDLVRRYRPDDFKGAALWTYFRGVEPLPEPNTGNILYAMFSWGWFWVIPLAGGVTSVGVVMNPPKFKEEVAKVNGKQELFDAAVASCPLVATMLAGAERVKPHHACADYSLDSERYCGDGWLLVGDAACFIDPILSTGVHLAMFGGYVAALALNTMFGDPAARTIDPIATFENLYRAEYQRLLRISRQQYELNKDCTDRFWSAHQILEPERTNPEYEIDRHAFIRLIAGHSSDRDEILALQRKDAEATFIKYGLGRFADESFLGERLIARGLEIATG